MQLARVIGTLVVAKAPGLEGAVLVVQPLDRQGRPQGEPAIAADGPGGPEPVFGRQPRGGPPARWFVPSTWPSAARDEADVPPGTRQLRRAAYRARGWHHAATIKDKTFAGHKLLLVDRLALDGKPTGSMTSLRTLSRLASATRPRPG